MNGSSMAVEGTRDMFCIVVESISAAACFESNRPKSIGASDCVEGGRAATVVDLVFFW